MKFFAFIMALLVLALSITPCADRANAMGGSKAISAITKTTHQQDDGQQDDCSPFCHCTCCAAFSVTHPTTSFKLLNFQGKPTYISYLPSQPIEVVLPIWQPPQLIA